MSESTTETTIEKRQPFEIEDLRAIASFEDAQRLLMANGVELLDASTEIGDGFSLLENKDVLVDVPFIALTWVFSDGDYPVVDEKGVPELDASGEPVMGKFCTMRVVTGDGKKLIVNDGGTGIAKQLLGFENRTGRSTGLLVQRGLRRSSYNHPIYGAGITHYLNV